MAAAATKKAASKAAASKDDSQKQAQEQEQARTAQENNDTNEKQGNRAGEPAGGVRGAGTGVDAPEESTARPPATIVNSDSSPLDPPRDQHTQTREPSPRQTTDNVYAEAGGRTIAGEDYSRLVDADGNTLSADALFDETDNSKTFVVAKQRVYEEFFYPNTNQPARRLLFAQGRRVPRAQADRIKAAVNDAPEPLAVREGRTDGGVRRTEGSDAKPDRQGQTDTAQSVPAQSESEKVEGGTEGGSGDEGTTNQK